MSFLATLFTEVGKVALVGVDAAAGAQAAKEQAKHDRKYGIAPAPKKKAEAGTTCTPCAARARVEAAKTFGRK